MVERIIWTQRAQKERKEILQFWITHNQNNNYSKKLQALFKETVQLISKYPKIGKPTDIEGVRVKIVRDYLLFYEINEEQLYILSIWDNRQNPDNLDL